MSDHFQSQKLYSGRAFDVLSVPVRLPDGKTKAYDLVKHAAAVTVVAVNEAGMVYFVRQHRVGAGRQLLELPAGVMEEGEEPETCARRELREETGMAAHNMERLGGLYPVAGYSSEYLYFYLATDLYEAPLPPDADEYLKVEMMPFAQAYELAEHGEMEDAKSVVGLFWARPHLNLE
ncbi:MAG TPA: NUDIX hydrolase [Anaerolineaceae bacterium]|nr:NUDIX hydrolase [Anaerolineaceae bacterium]HPN52101.1 NUDIX hydrolase [Anaerolineaceae bacterium]